MQFIDTVFEVLPAEVQANMLGNLGDLAAKPPFVPQVDFGNEVNLASKSTWNAAYKVRVLNRQVRDVNEILRIDSSLSTAAQTTSSRLPSRRSLPTATA